jgi:hypothetical protein
MQITVVKKKAKPIAELILKIRGKFLTIEDTDGFHTEKYSLVNPPQNTLVSTLLSRWCNKVLSNHLMELSANTNTVQRIVGKPSVDNRYWFREREDTIYGLHKIKNKIEKHTSVVIDDHIGTANIRYILNRMGLDLEFEYDLEKGLIRKIFIIKLKV